MAIIETKKSPTTKDTEDKRRKEKTTQFVGKADFASKYLIEPWITEKSHLEMSQNKYIFRVSPDSNKKIVKKSVEDLYKVNVTGVNIVNIHPKKRIYGRTKGFKSGFKKAVVTLKEGDKIQIFEGV